MLQKISGPDATKIAMFTDIHWGVRSNSVQHNQDNLDYVDWFIKSLPSDISHIAFLGDWFENRSAINVQTLSMSAEGLQKLDKLGIPIMFITGNHDLYRRTTRDIHSLSVFSSVRNVTIVEDAISLNGKQLFLPYLFDHEFLALADIINAHETVYGHFEFNDFVLTGHSTIMERGQDRRLVSKPKKIFSGHFHKRQVIDNICYIGNTFPTNFGDAGDDARGMAVYDVAADKVEFKDWEDCPKYLKVKLGDVIANKWSPKAKTRVKCVVDIDISYTEAQELREALIEAHNLRDLVLEEDREAKQGLVEGDSSKVTEVHDLKFDSVDELVTSQLEAAIDDGAAKGKYDLKLLLEIYKSLKIETTDKDATA
jgi:DNA repair exonuclease SbcCD nuclease subunit